MPALLPENTKDKKSLLAACHNDPTEATLAAAKNLLAKEELLLLGVALNSTVKVGIRADQKIQIDETFLQSLVATLPYQLTDGQRKAAWDY